PPARALNLQYTTAAPQASRTRWRCPARRYSRLFHPPILHTPPQPCPRQSHSLRLPYWSSPRAASNPEPRADRDQLPRSRPHEESPIARARARQRRERVQPCCDPRAGRLLLLPTLAGGSVGQLQIRSEERRVGTGEEHGDR